MLKLIDSGSDARSSIGKHALQVLRNWLGEPQMQRVARNRWPDRGESEGASKGPASAGRAKALEEATETFPARESSTAGNRGAKAQEPSGGRRGFLEADPAA
jgi:hypothetical protein